MPLTCEQLAIVRSTKTYVDVRAVPGCGKTHTAISCVKHWTKLGIPEANILVLSFSNTTVEHFKQRLGMTDVCVSTVHAIGLHLQETKHRVLEPSESKELLHKAMEQLIESARLSSGRFAARRKRRAKTLVTLRPNIAAFSSAISYARARCMSLTSFLEASTDFGVLKLHTKPLEVVLKRYEALKLKSGLVDFDDLVDPTVSSVMASGFHWTHVIVDEAQDCTEAQARMIASLCNQSKLQAFRSFSDPMQALYGFAGAGGVEFAELLDCHVMTINSTRRLTKPIAALATYISGKGTQTIHASRRGRMPELIRSEWNDLGRDVFHHVRRRLSADPRSTVAILARTKAQIRGIDQALRAQGIWAFSLNSKQYSNDLLRVLKVCHYLANKEKPAREVASGLAPCLAHLNAEPSARVTKTVETYLIQAWASSNLEARFSLIIKAYTALQPSDERKALRNELRLWLPFARQHESARIMWQALRVAKEERVILSTIHSAKGREWEHVMVLGVTEGSLPIYLAKDEKQLAEERRVLYVAVTRAKATVQLYHTPLRHPHTGAVLSRMSRYVGRAQNFLKRLELP